MTPHPFFSGPKERARLNTTSEAGMYGGGPLLPLTLLVGLDVPVPLEPFEILGSTSAISSSRITLALTAKPGCGVIGELSSETGDASSVGLFMVGSSWRGGWTCVRWARVSRDAVLGLGISAGLDSGSGRGWLMVWMRRMARMMVVVYVYLVCVSFMVCLGKVLRLGGQGNIF